MRFTFLTLIITFSFTYSFAQVDVNLLSDTEKKILKTFKEIYVDKNFKDPYSFELLKLEASPTTLGDWVLNDIAYIKKTIEKGDFRFSKKEDLEIRLKENEEKYLNMSEEVKKYIKSYAVRIDCYGSNNYGNKILGKYNFNFVLIDGNMNQVDYYKNPSLLFVSKIN
jgi:hypothetical protein